MDRMIILKGAPLKLASEGKNFTLIGSENSSTLAESASIVRDYLYLQERLDQLQGLSYRAGQSRSLIDTADSASLRFFSELLSERSLDSAFVKLQDQASTEGKTELADLIFKTQGALKECHHRHQAGDPVSQAVGKEKNPYQEVRNEKRLQKLLSEAEGKIEEVIVKRRNEETAENLVKALKEEGKTVGVLQFGAGHEEGLLGELNARGLSVIVLVPSEVSQRKDQ